MEGPPKRQVNADEMLAELKRALESSTRVPNVPPPSASTVSKSGSLGRESRRSQIDEGSDHPIKANADSSIGQPTDLHKWIRPSSRSWKLATAGVALAGVAAVFAGFVLMNQAPPPKRELSVAPAGLVRTQNEQALKPTSDSRAPMQESRQAAPPQTGALETRPDAGVTPANSGSAPAQGKAGLDASHLGSLGLDSAAPALMPVPPNLGAIPVPAQVIGPDGAPIAAAPSTSGSNGSAPQSETPKRAAPPVPSQKTEPDAAQSTSASTDSAPPAETPKPAATPAPSPRTGADAAPTATAPSAPASTDSAPPAEAPKPNATPTEHASNEPERPSTPRIDSKRKPLGKPSLHKPRRSAKASTKPVAQAERRSTEPARPKEAEQSPEPAQGAGNPTPAAPVAAPAPTVQQRFADGVTHAFGYLMHLPGALVSHSPDPNAGAH